MILSIEKCFAWTLRGLLQPFPAGLRLRIARRLYYFDSYHVHGFEATVVYFDTMRFHLNTKEAIGWRIFFSGEYERTTNLTLEAICEPGDIVIDAGANNGSETLLAALFVGPEGKVIAFEPVPHVHQRLLINVTSNTLNGRVVLEHVALGPDDCETVFYLTPKSAPNQGMSSQFLFPGASGALRVRMQRLDQWAAENALTRLDVIKMDIQGGELGLLEGGRVCIEKYRPIIFTEASIGESEQAGRSLSELWRHLAALDYEIWCCSQDSSTFSPLPTATNLVEGCWLALPRAHSKRIASIKAKLHCVGSKNTDILKAQ